MFLWNHRNPCCSLRNRLLKFYVGDALPTSTPMDVNKFTFCAYFNRAQPLRGFNGITCRYYTLGRYAVISTSYHAMYIYEVAVFGIPSDSFKTLRNVLKP